MTMARKKAAHAQRGHPQRGGTDSSPHDALVLLTADHNVIEKLVREFERARKAEGPVEKGKVALRICHTIEIYAVIKHEVLYPAADAVLDDEDKALLGKARVRHDGLQELIDKVEYTPADDPTFDFVISSGTQPRLWIDAVSHVTMGRDRRTYRFLHDGRLGRTVLAESPDIKPVADQVTRYVAERLVERQRMMSGEVMTMGVPGGVFEMLHRPEPANPWTAFLLGLALVVAGGVVGVATMLFYLSLRFPELGIGF